MNESKSQASDPIAIPAPAQTLSQTPCNEQTAPSKAGSTHPSSKTAQSKQATTEGKQGGPGKQASPEGKQGAAVPARAWEPGHHPGGRPPMFATPESLQSKIDEYFKKVKEDLKDDPKARPLITEMALFVGFADEQSFHDYAAREEFTTTIKKARARVRASYERNLYGSNVIGSIFALKNMGWHDGREVSVSAQDSGPVTVTIAFDKPKPATTGSA